MAAPFRYLLLFTGFSACAQFDSGALAAFVDFLHKTLGFSTEDIGYINAMEYVLLPIASPLIPCLLKCLKVKIVLLVCLVGNMLGVFGLVMGPKMHESGDSAFTLFVVSRAISGICHAGIAVYGSVWVDLHAPKDQAASWLGAMQASSLVGLVVGYTVAGYSEDWVTVFCVNLAWFAATFACLAFAASEFIGSATVTSGHRSGSLVRRLSFVSVPSGSFVDQADWADAREVELTEEPEVGLMSTHRPASASEQNVQNLPVYALMAFCVSSLFFVSGGLQFWATPYMEQIRLKELEGGPGGFGAGVEGCAQVHSLVVTLVAVITLTAPTFGVFLGGGAVDSIGGYKGAAGRSTLKLLATGALLAMVFGVTACFSTNFWLAVSTFWVFNMLGAALLPGAFGLMLASVRSEKTSAASAIAQIPINLLGMAGGAYIPGWLTGCKEDASHGGGAGPSCDADCDYALGLRSLLLGPVFGFLCLILSLLLYRSPSESEETDNQELTLQAPRRARAHTANTVVLGIIDQLDGKAGTMVLRMDEEVSLAKLLARAAECTGNATRRLFAEDGQEILSIQDVRNVHAKNLADSKAKPSIENPAMSIDLELVSTDGSNFKWKWGSNHAHYQFGDLLIRPFWRTLAGSRAARSVLHPPQPKTLPTTGNLKDCLPDLWIQCFPLVEKYGPLVKLRIFDDVVYVVADPEIVDIVNQIPDKRLPREVFGCPALAGQGVFIADGQRWEFARQTFQAQLTPEAIDNLVPIFAMRGTKLKEKISTTTETVDIFNWIERTTMDTICDVGFGHDLQCMESEDMPELLPLFEEVLEVSISTSLYGAFDVLGTQRRWFKSQLDKLTGMLDEIIEACREGKSTGSSNSLLHALIAAKCPLTGRSFTQSELQDQLLTMLVAGHKTTTLLLTWALYHIGRSPQVEKKLYAELRQVFQGDDREPTGEDLRRLKYLDMIVRETLRISAPVQVAQRGLTQPVECGKYTLLPGGHSGRGNSWVAIHIMGISMSKKYWGENSKEFIPERFEPAKMRDFHPFQFIPFGGGRRLCIGNLFAITQAKTVISILLRKFYVRCSLDKPVKIDPKDIATPLPAHRGGGVWMNFTSREHDEPAAADLAAGVGALHEDAFDSATAPQAAAESFLSRRSRVASVCSGGPRPALLVLWGGEFGTTLNAAQDLVAAAKQREFPVELKALDEVRPAALLAGEIKSETGEVPIVLVLVATYNGHPPPNAANFLKELAEVPAGEEGSRNLSFAVLGVGNSNWVSTFVKSARDVEKLMLRAGANRLLPLEAADKNDVFERQLRTWRKAVFAQFASSPEELVKESEGQSHVEALPELLSLEPCEGAAEALEAHFERLGYATCAVSINEELCIQSDASSPSVRQIVIERPDGCSYACGDHLEVRPRNAEARVLRCCHHLGVQSDALVVVTGVKDEELPSGRPIAIGEILSYYVDLSALPSQETLASLLPHVANASEAAKMKLLTLTKEDSEYDRWSKSHLSILDVFEEYASLKVTLSRFVEVAPKMQSRLYSIASSPMSRGKNVELCCRVATYTASPNGQESIREGLCSSMLAGATSVICKIKEAPHMRLPPDPTKPIACVCGGTGVAPFLGFLQEREACRKKGIQTGLVSLYFGCRNDSDFLHKKLLQRWHEEGLCSLKLSLSRPTDGSSKEYVYHALRRNSAEILRLLDDGDASGYFYICGSASTLAKDVTNVLVDMLSDKGDASTGFTKLTDLQEKGRVIFDVWG